MLQAGTCGVMSGSCESSMIEAGSSTMAHQTTPYFSRTLAQGLGRVIEISRIHSKLTVESECIVVRLLELQPKCKSWLHESVELAPLLPFPRAH